MNTLNAWIIALLVSTAAASPAHAANHEDTLDRCWSDLRGRFSAEKFQGMIQVFIHPEKVKGAQLADLLEQMVQAGFRIETIFTLGIQDPNAVEPEPTRDPGRGAKRIETGRPWDMVEAKVFYFSIPKATEIYPDANSLALLKAVQSQSYVLQVGCAFAAGPGTRVGN